MARAWLRSLRWIGSGPNHAAPSVSVDQIRATLRENDLIAGYDEVIEELLEAGNVVTFEEGQRFIKLGDQDDDVYFLLRGEVDILSGKRRCDGREAPQVVGELAAASPGTRRTATVIAGASGVTALRVPADVFRGIRDTSPEVRRRHESRVGHIMRQNTLLAGLPDGERSLSWTKICTIVGAFGAILCGIYTWSIDWDAIDILVGTVACGIVLFAVMMWFSVKRMVMALILTASAAIIGLFAPWSLSGNASIAPVETPWFDLSLALGWQGEPGEKVVPVVALLILIAMLSYLHRHLPD